MIKFLFLIIFASLVSFGQSHIFSEKQAKLKTLEMELNEITEKINRLDDKQGKYITHFSELMHQLFLEKTTKWSKKKRDRKWDQEIFLLIRINEKKQVILEEQKQYVNCYYIVAPGMCEFLFNPIMIHQHYEPIIWHARPSSGDYCLDEIKEEEEKAKFIDQKKLDEIEKKEKQLSKKINNIQSQQKVDVSQYFELLYQAFYEETIGWSKKKRKRVWRKELFYLLPVNENKQVILNPGQYNQAQYYLIVSRKFEFYFIPILIHKQYLSILRDVQNKTFD